MSLNGNYKIICGDCRTRDSYAALGIGPNQRQANVLLTDPPYCILERRRKGGDLRDEKHSRTRKVRTGDGSINEEIPRFSSVKDFREFTKSWLDVCINEALTTDATLIIWMNGLGQNPVISVCKDFGYVLVGEYIWAKETSQSSNLTPASIPSSQGSRLFMKNKNEILLRVNEAALVFKRSVNASSSIITTSVITDNSAASHAHPCHKPLSAIVPLLHQWTRPNDVVIDPFAGSAGILEAVSAIGDGRKGYGIEILERWVKK